MTFATGQPVEKAALTLQHRSEKDKIKHFEFLFHF